jgi:hypothetical protein
MNLRRLIGKKIGLLEVGKHEGKGKRKRDKEA